MSIEKHIDRFLLLISDPRNIAPDEFAEYYPKIGEKYNPKNLDKGAVEKHFERLQKFKFPEDWNGYIDLEAKLYLLLKSFEKQSIKSKETALHYYVLRAKNLNMKTQSFATEQLLSKAEYYNLSGAYMVFCNNLNSLIINNFKALMAKHGDNVVDTFKLPKEKSYKESLWFKAGLCFAEGKMDKYVLNGTMSPNWSAPRISKELNLPECEKYFLGTINNYKKNNKNHDKNVFNNIEHLDHILKHCEENNIEVSESFKNRYNESKDKNT